MPNVRGFGLDLVDYLEYGAPYRGDVRRLLSAVLFTLPALIALGGCGDPRASSEQPDPPGRTHAPTSTAVPSNVVTETPHVRRTNRDRSAAPRLRGVDASHHQGVIDWPRVAGAGYAFVYLKASEGSTFTDPRFATNRLQAQDAGLRVGGYHYFTLCSPGAPQAAHFVDVLGDQPVAGLPPAVDLELTGACADPPAPDALLAEVRTFLADVEEATGVEPVVYLYPDFEERYGLADDLADHRQWVRSLGTAPRRDWWMWQKSDSASVPGIDGPADLNILGGS